MRKTVSTIFVTHTASFEKRKEPIEIPLKGSVIDIMKIEIVSTGEEVLSGVVIDSNASYIACVLNEAGYEVVRHSCVGDKKNDIAGLLKECTCRADAVVVTGGLGPTDDDRTVEAACEAWGVEPVHDHDAEMSVEACFRKMGLPVPDTNRKQMLVPEGSISLENSKGTAPGFYRKYDKTYFFFIPGVPWEMRHMMNCHVLPMLKDIAGDDHVFFRSVTISHFGISEAEVNKRLRNVETVFPGTAFGLQAVFPVIQAKLYRRGNDLLAVDSEIKKAEQWVFERTGDYIFSTRGFSMAEEVGDILVKKGKTIAVAESCTGGLIAHMITDIPGSSAYFLFSAVTYSNEAKTGVLGVKPQTISSCGAVSHETVREMAESTRKISGADFGLAVSGIAGPAGGTAEKPVGTVYIAVASQAGVVSHFFHSPFGERDKNKKIFAVKALDLLRREILES